MVKSSGTSSCRPVINTLLHNNLKANLINSKHFEGPPISTNHSF